MQGKLSWQFVVGNRQFLTVHNIKTIFLIASLSGLLQTANFLQQIAKNQFGLYIKRCKHQEADITHMLTEK